MTVSATDFFETAGGKGLNQALAAARSGASVSFVGAVGEDDAGRLVRRVLADSAVDASRLREMDEPTGRAVIVVEPSGENRIVLLPGANATMTSLVDSDCSVVRNADALLLQLELPQSIVVEAAEAAHEAGVLVGLTAAPVQPIGRQLLESTSIIFVNEHELAVLGPGVDSMLDLVPAVLVTRGESGSDYADRSGARLHVDALSVDVVDTTAAGDVYAGAFMWARCSGAPVEVAMAWATAAASLAVGRRGASSSIPTEEEISALGSTAFRS